MALAAAWLCAAVLAAVLPRGQFTASWLSAGVVFSIALAAVALAWQANSGGRGLAGLLAAAFLVRLIAGLVLHLALPVVGFDEEAQRAGYPFLDAYRRDSQAWQLAQSDRPLWASFGEEFFTDQYGGLLSLSAGVYRYLSPDTQRPELILILAAAAVAAGLPFLWRAVQQRWNAPLAWLTGWIAALYPDGIFFSSAAMREPFLIGLICVLLWGVLMFARQKRASIWAIGLSLLGMALVSSRVALIAAGATAVLFWLEHLWPRSPRWRLAGLAVLLAGGLLLGAASWEWFHASTGWDLTVTERSSGWVQRALEQVGGQYRAPFIIGYGLAQPVLPAALADPTLPIWKTIVIARALGWYLLAPLLVYAAVSVWRVRPASERRSLAWLAVFVLLWLVISSARAGGDLTDNPRYRIIFLPLLALLAAWGLQWAVQRKDAWLLRWLAVEAIFVGFFTNWYFSRYFHLWSRLPFWTMVAWITGLSAAVILSGILWDAWKRRRAAPLPVPGQDEG